MTFNQAIKEFNNSKQNAALRQRFHDIYVNWKNYNGNSGIEREARRKSLERFLLKYL